MRKILITLMLATAAIPATAEDSFRLSMDKIRATVTALKDLVEVVSADPGLQTRYKAAAKQLPDTNGRDSVSLTAEALIAKEPKIAAVYRKAGISPREAGMTMETLVGTAMGVGMLEAAGKKDADLPKGFVAENIAFYKAHQAEIVQVLNELKNVKGKLPEDEDEADEEDEK